MVLKMFLGRGEGGDFFNLRSESGGKCKAQRWLARRKKKERKEALACAVLGAMSMQGERVERRMRGTREGFNHRGFMSGRCLPLGVS